MHILLENKWFVKQNGNLSAEQATIAKLIKYVFNFAS